jgi:hypothetical protein
MFSRCRGKDLGVGVQEDSRNVKIKAKEQSTHAKESQGLECLAATKPVAQRVDCKSRWGEAQVLKNGEMGRLQESVGEGAQVLRKEERQQQQREAK